MTFFTEAIASTWFFPTPTALAARMVDLSGLGRAPFGCSSASPGFFAFVTFAPFFCPSSFLAFASSAMSSAA